MSKHPNPQSIANRLLSASFRVGSVSDAAAYLIAIELSSKHPSMHSIVQVINRLADTGQLKITQAGRFLLLDTTGCNHMEAQ